MVFRLLLRVCSEWQVGGGGAREGHHFGFESAAGGVRQRQDHSQ